MESQLSINPILLDPAFQPNKLYASYTNFTDVRMLGGKPETKQVPGQNGGPPGASYKVVPMRYNYGANGTSSWDDLYIELCEMEAPGLVTKTPPGSTKEETSIQIRFNIGDPVHDKILACLDSVYECCVHALDDNKIALGLSDYPFEMLRIQLKGLVYRPKDPVTKQLLPGKSPSMFLKCFSRGKAPYETRTLFTRPDKSPIDWKLLFNSDITFIPLIHLKRIYVGTKPSIQIELYSAVVTSIVPRGTSTRQGDTCDNLLSSKPDLVDLVASQIQRITSERQDQLIPSNVKSAVGNEGENAGDKEAVSESGQPGQQAVSSNMYQQAPAGVSSFATFGGLQAGSTGYPPVPSLGDFVANAPVRTSGYPSTPSFTVPSFK